MNDLPEKTGGKKDSSIPAKLSRLSDCVLKSDYDVTLQMFADKDSKTPECSHHLKGNMTHDVKKLMALCGVAVGAMALCAAAVCICRKLMCN